MHDRAWQVKHQSRNWSAVFISRSINLKELLYQLDWKVIVGRLLCSNLMMRAEVCRKMKCEERRGVLGTLFECSGWGGAESCIWTDDLCKPQLPTLSEILHTHRETHTQCKTTHSQLHAMHWECIACITHYIIHWFHAWMLLLSVHECTNTSSRVKRERKAKGGGVLFM